MTIVDGSLARLIRIFCGKSLSLLPLDLDMYGSEYSATFTSGPQLRHNNVVWQELEGRGRGRGEEKSEIID